MRDPRNEVRHDETRNIKLIDLDVKYLISFSTKH